MFPSPLCSSKLVNRLQVGLNFFFCLNAATLNAVWLSKQVIMFRQKQPAASIFMAEY